ncbi:MAG TPA: TIGR03435 family protein [Bryobacteraceae bacterium]|jgi:hypothetical protein|nr:TIGR03435 family protein [Bryobacteraceae bacterium]
MNPAYLLPIADHLWQSTLLAGTAGLLTLCLRTNHARVRHWLWLTASCKFLIPLSFLIAIGGHLSWRTPTPRKESGLSVVVQEVSQPFTGPAASTPLLPTPRVQRSFPVVLLAILITGFAGIAVAWCIRWRRIRRIEGIMIPRLVRKMNVFKRIMLGTAAVAAISLPITLGIIHAPIVRAQPQRDSDWQAAAGGKMAFEVASVKLDKGPFRSPNFPLDNGNAFTPGDRFSADFPLLTYVQFAYKVRLSPQQRESMLAHLPKWLNSDRFAIEAKAAGPATKDQMRLMMQSLLADRFGLEVHFETRETAVLAYTHEAGKDRAEAASA